MTALRTRSCVVCVRLSASDHAAFIVAARRLQESRARLLRRAVRELIGCEAPLYPSERKALVQAVYQLKAVARNLTQLRQAVQQGKAMGDGEMLASTHTAVVCLDTRIAALVRASRFPVAPR